MLEYICQSINNRVDLDKWKNNHSHHLSVFVLKMRDGRI